MICVCIGRGRHKHVIAEHAHLVQQGAKLVELRLDYIAGEVNLKRLLENRPSPVVISCRRQCDGGRWGGSEEDRLVLLRSAIAEGVEYVDLEDEVAKTVPRFGKTKRIVSLHDFAKTPDNLEEIHARLASQEADVIKLATVANNPLDNIRMLNLMASSSVPTIGLCMGDMGTPSRILAGRFGAPFTYATFHHERALAPGQMSFKQMRETFRYETIDSNTEVFGVIADPIGHSLSPVIHNAAFNACEMNRIYVPFRVPRVHLDDFLRNCRHLGIRGLSVTIPHKEAVLKHCTKVDPAVKGIGAANTLVFRGDDVIGYNTDHRGALESLMAAMELPADGKPLNGRTALVLGAGGAAKAIAYGLLDRGATVVVAARDLIKANFFAEKLSCRLVEWDARHTVNADVLVNCTPIGMHPNVDETPYEKHHLRPSLVVFDTVYNPEQTLLIKQAREKHAVVVTGVDMFVRQAALQLQYFTGQPAPTDLMRDVLKRTIGAIKY